MLPQCYPNYKTVHRCFQHGRATKHGKDVKIMGIVDRHGLPLSVSAHTANHHEVTLVQLSFDFYMLEAKPENLVGDRAYDSDPLDEQLRREGYRNDCAAAQELQAAQDAGRPPLAPPVLRAVYQR